MNRKTVYRYRQLKNNAHYSASNLPVLKSSSDIPVLSAQGILAVDLGSAVVLYEKNPNEHLLPASTTKMITALVAMDIYDNDEVLNTGHVSVEGQKMGLEWNENISVQELLYGLLVHSANDAAEVLAQNYSQGRDAFIQKMNEKAHALHAQDTVFKNPSGLDAEGQYTTAKDLAQIATAAMKNTEFASIVATKEHIARSADGKVVHYLTNRNELLGKVSGVLGVKTGWTEEARENLVTYVERDGRDVVISLLGSQDRFGETEELVNWLFANYSWEPVNSDSTELSQNLHSNHH